MKTLRIATYNVNGIRSRVDNLFSWLERTAPDIACLQELKAPDEHFPESDLKDLGYDAIWHGQKSWNGVAILSRGGLTEIRRGLPGDPDDTHSRYIEALCHGITVGCLYLPNGNPWPGPKFDYKLRWFERLAAHAKTLLARNGPVVLAGDYNVIPTPFDAHKPENWVRDALFSPEAREAYRRLLEQGWTDALRALNPDRQVFTYWDYFRNAFARDAGIRIDHQLLNAPASKALVSAGVDREERGLPHPSDHAPVWIELRHSRS